MIKIPFAPTEFLSDTVHLSPCAVGIYIRLTCYMYQSQRPLPIDQTSLERIAGAHTDAERAELSIVLQGLFTQADHGYTNPKATKILEVLNNKTQGARAAAKSRWSTKITNTPNPDIPYTEIIEHLNQKTAHLRKGSSTGFRITDQVRMKINQRWAEGFRLNDFKSAIENMISKWGGDPKFSFHLNPKTLFGDNLNSYANIAQSPHEQTQNSVIDNTQRLNKILLDLEKAKTKNTDPKALRKIEDRIAAIKHQLGIGGA